MSCIQEPRRPFLPFGNPLRTILSKGPFLSPKPLALLNDFENALAERLEKLKPADKEDILHISWMRRAMESLCGIHSDVNNFITTLELPVCDWNDKWIDVYLFNSAKLLDICTSFSSEICRLTQSHLYLQCALHDLSSPSPNHFVRVHSSLDGWGQNRTSKNPRLDNCFNIIDSLVETLDLPKVKNSAKGTVLMRAMYGVKVITLFVCSIFVAAFTGSAKKLMDLHVPETCLWAGALAEIKMLVSCELKRLHSNGRLIALKELEAVDVDAKKLYPVVQNSADPTECEGFRKLRDNLAKSTGEFSQGINLLAKETDSFFHILMMGRDALLCNLRVSGKLSDQLFLSGSNMKDQTVR